MTIRLAKDNTKINAISERERILRRTFKMYIRKGKYEQSEFHDFCKFAKGKSEYKLLSELGIM
ncbi:hypothetical protein AsFcp4_257 [Aeromonas phage AsFcp_4]|nr:hypothetical protein ASfcp2_20 [Aeromonas phage AsFcp_2]QAX99709.1 hypothetical protein AsFcp4_257 [Aeromonas phage AsFcp_4]